ncbi:hypothetical protein AAF712_011180 [Marasmius tenuissimus]|uniref:Uncharacterized protein n=1 Tax=Marasmius tenuissimus TaxID=585030 RepID=A0ABR2ZL56_9AGAR
MERILGLICGTQRAQEARRHAADWTTSLRDEYRSYVELKKKEKNTQSVREALAEEIRWFEDRFMTFWDEKKQEGKFDTTLARILAPFLNLAQHARQYYGVHIFGYTIVTERDLSGRSCSCIWGASLELGMLKERNQTKLAAQITDIDTMFRVVEMELRDIPTLDRDVALLLMKKQSERNDERAYLRRVTTALLGADTEALLDGKQLSVYTWAKRAGKYKLVIRNWPLGIAFPGVGDQQWTSLSGSKIAKVINTRIKFLERVQKGEATKEERQARNFFKVEKWSDDEIELELAEQAKLPIVTDTNGDIVLTVEDGLKASGMDAQEGLEKALAPKKKGRKGGKGKEREIRETTPETVPRVEAAAQQKELYTDDEGEEEGEESQRGPPSAQRKLVRSRSFDSYNEEGLDNDPPHEGVSSVRPVGKQKMRFVEVDRLTSPPKGARTVLDDDFEDDDDDPYENLLQPPPRLGTAAPVAGPSNPRVHRTDFILPRPKSHPRPRPSSAGNSEDLNEDYLNLPRPKSGPSPSWQSRRFLSSCKRASGPAPGS